MTMDKKKNCEEEKGNFLLFLHDLYYILAVFLLAVLLMIRIVVVVGPSMRNTLQDGDCLILISSIWYPQPKYGDIVVASKRSFDDGKSIIKRVIATEGQTVDIDFERGIVYVDGHALEEDYVNTATTLQEGVQFPLTVGEGEIFVLGDNRNNSKDSRNPEIGLIDCREVLGKAILLVFPGKDTDDNRDYKRIGVIS